MGDTAAQPPPTGLVTFLASDVVASSRIWSRSSDAAKAMGLQRMQIERAVRERGGYLPPDQGEGDSTLSVFADPAAALEAALQAQRQLLAEAWPDDARVSVRMAILTGAAEILEGGNYGGVPLIRCARLRSHARGGQVLVAAGTAELAADRLPEDAHLTELGAVSLEGLERPERVHQLCHPQLPSAVARLGAPLANVLPNPATRLVGRDSERKEIAALLETSRLVTISGAGGSGKTRLAIAAAGDARDRFEDGVVWVELGGLASGGQVAGSVAAACGVAESPGTPTLDALVARIRSARLLLVLDNCEHVLDACGGLVGALLSGAPAVQVLTTSRESLGIGGETVWRIPGLGVPEADQDDPEALATHSAAELFLERARAVEPHFEIDADTAPAVARICRRLDGLPMALELAAARLTVLPVQALADRLDERFRLLTGGSRTAVERQRTLRASVEWSYDLLDEAEKTLFRRLAMFSAPFTIAAAEAVGGGDPIERLDVFDLLSRLVDKSLVQRVGERYRLLETLRQFGIDRAADAGEIDALRTRHLEAFRRRAAEWGVDERLVTDGVLAEMTLEYPDLLAALEWSIEQGEPSPELVEVLGEIWFLLVRLDDVRSVMTRALGCLEAGSTPWLRVLAPVVPTLWLAGVTDWKKAARSFDSEELTVRERLRLGFAPGVELDRFMLVAQQTAHAHIAAAREAELRAEEVSHHMNLALAVAQNGYHHEMRRTLAWLERNTPKDAVRRQFVSIATFVGASLQCEFARCRVLLDEMLNSPVHGSGVRSQSALLGFWTGDVRLVAEAVDYADSGGFAGAFAGFAGLAHAFRALLAGDAEAADRALREAETQPAIGGTLSAQLHRAELAISRGALDEAKVLVEDAGTQVAEGRPPYQTAWTLRVRAMLAARQGETQRARELAHESLDLGVENDVAMTKVEALETLATLPDALEPDTAARLLGACEAFRAQKGFAWRHAYREEAIEALRRTLPPDAWAEGTGLSLDEAAEYARRGRGERRRPAFGWESLTPSEQRVVELVGQGLPNKDIAKALFVSLSTVKTHLIHVYRKLDVKTRADLAAEVARRSERARPTT